MAIDVKIKNEELVHITLGCFTFAYKAFILVSLFLLLKIFRISLSKKKLKRNPYQPKGKIPLISLLI